MSKKTASILIVDDEQIVLTSLRGLFNLQTDFHLVEASDPKSALDELKRQPIDVVISDFLMPNMTGIEFLKQARELQPEAARLLLTGYSDKENAIRAINEVGLYHYVEKPWDNDALLNIVRNALNEKKLKRDLTEKIRVLDRLAAQHSALEGKHRVLQRELEMAARVQRSLIPESLPRIGEYELSHYYEPCAAVGGDFFDLHIGENETLLLVADVVGHGVQASLTTMLLKGVFQEEAETHRDVVRLVTRMNSRLFRVMPDHIYAAATVLSVPTEGDEIPFTSAGLPYPFVLRAAPARLDEIVLTGAPLGLFSENDTQYESRAVRLEPGDVLLVGSDGIGSIESSAGEFFEDSALRSHLTALSGGLGGNEILCELVKRARAFGPEGAGLPDDVNLVTVQKH